MVRSKKCSVLKSRKSSEHDNSNSKKSNVLEFKKRKTYDHNSQLKQEVDQKKNAIIKKMKKREHAQKAAMILENWLNKKTG
jgi:hypothetical protein